MKKVITLLLALLSLLTLGSKTSTLTYSPSTKEIKLIDEFEGDDEDEEYYEEDYEYDGFLDEVIIDASMEDDEENVYFNGCTTYDYGEFNFSLNFNIEELKYEHDFSQTDVYVECDKASVDAFGRLESEILIENPESGEQENYKVSEFRDLNKLEKFVKDPEQYIISTPDEVSTCGLWSIIKKVIVAVVVIYVVVAETAEQIKARINHKDNQKLEESGNGVDRGNYITDQTEGYIDGRTENVSKYDRNGYKSAYYKFGFAHFKDVGCEVASVYNLMISEGRDQNLSDVIYDFERWAIEFAVGWGYLGSNPRDIYRYLRNYDIKYSKNNTYFFFKLKFYFAPEGTRFIMSTWNKNLLDGLHTYLIIKQNDFLEAYNFHYDSEPKEYSSLDYIYSQMGNFIIGYKIL